MTEVALVAALVALGAAVVLWLRVGALEAQSAALRGELGQARAELTAIREQCQSGMRDLRMELRRESGQIRFLPSMTIAEALQLHPRAASVLESFKLGSCSNCAVSDVDTLEGACRSYGIDLNGLMAALSALVAPAGLGADAGQRRQRDGVSNN